MQQTNSWPFPFLESSGWLNVRTTNCAGRGKRSRAQITAWYDDRSLSLGYPNTVNTPLT